MCLKINNAIKTEEMTEKMHPENYGDITKLRMD